MAPPYALDAAAMDVWTALEDNYAPLVLGDRFGDAARATIPNVNDCAWVSLYALAILTLRNMRKELPVVVQPTTRPVNLPWQSLVASFFDERQQQIDAFKAFLHSWDLGLRFGIPKVRNLSKLQAQWQADERVLGYHQFSEPSGVASYVLRWKENAEIQTDPLVYHRLVASRGIDLICSELISNGFEHTRNEGTRSEVFIMAKLSSPQSAWLALQLDNRRGHLSETERRYFQEATNDDYPILQLVIGDSGYGFQGNRSLQALHVSALGSDSPSPTDLINFALLPHVSTKIFSEESELEWAKYLTDVTSVHPVIHGLSEVLLYVKEMRGFWRIHSNDATVDEDFSETAIHAGISRRSGFGQNVHGCLHYIMLPLPKKRPAGLSRYVTVLDKHKFTIIDSAEKVLAGTSQVATQLSDKDWRDGIVRVCKAIHAASAPASPPPILINLTMVDQAPVKLTESLLALLADTLHRVRGQVPVFICGASEPTKSLLKRYQGMQNFFFDRRVLPFVTLHGTDEGEVEVEVECGTELHQIKSQLNRALSPTQDSNIQRSENERWWNLFEEVALHNEGLFAIYRDGISDHRFDGRVKLAPSDASTRRLLLGGRSSHEFISKLQEHQALVHSRFLRLGKYHETYVHIGRLWADQSYIADVTAWLAIALQAILLRHHGPVDQQGPAQSWWSDLDLVAVLHPAIDLAHGLAAHPLFREASITEIRRLGDIRWDSPPILNLSGRRKVVCIFDLIYEGLTASRLLDELTYVDGTPIAIISVLKMGNYAPSKGIPVAAFSECSKADVERVAHLGAAHE